jgi:hypothetical protein
MTDYQAFLTKLHQNLNTLREREAKYADNAPLELLNQISDHKEAIALTEQALTGDLGEAEWQERLQPLLISVAPFRAAQNIVVILGQYAPDKGNELSQQVGPQANEIASELLTTALDHLRQSPKGSLIADEFEQDPVTYQKPVEKALAQAIVADRELAAKLKSLLVQYGQAMQEHRAATGSSYQATIRGTGSVAQGPGASAVTATEGGIAIGSIGGDVHLGQVPAPPQPKQDEQP